MTRHFAYTMPVARGRHPAPRRIRVAAIQAAHYPTGVMFTQGCSSVGRAAVSKTVGREFESYHPCQNNKNMSRSRGVAWLNTLDCHSRDRGFKSRRLRHSTPSVSTEKHPTHLALQPNSSLYGFLALQCGCCKRPMSDLLDSLMAGASVESSTTLPKLPLHVLVGWFYADGKARNLSERTVEFYRNKLVYLIQAAGNRQPHEVTATHLRLLVAHFREKRKWSTGTTNHFITAMKVFFNFLIAEGFLTDNPADKLIPLKEDQHLPDPLQQKEVKCLLAVLSTKFCGVRDRAMLLVLLDTGVRLGELMGMTPEDIDLEQCQLRIRRSKSRKERMVPFSGITRRALVKYLTQRSARSEDQSLWVTDTGSSISKWYLMKRFESLGRLAGVPRFHCHRLRHTMATEFLRNGGNFTTLQHILGHTTGRMTERYVHFTDADAQAGHLSASPVEQWGLESTNRRGHNQSSRKK